jgi:thiamine pyrophosphate-dependent acetolactate synthase large subunit-like protein
MAQQPPQSRQNCAQPALRNRLSVSSDQSSGFAINQEGNSLVCAAGTALAAAEEQVGDETVRPAGDGGIAFSAAKAGTAAQRASRASIIMNVFIPSTSWLSGWQESQASSNKKV